MIGIGRLFGGRRGLRLGVALAVLSGELAVAVVADARAVGAPFLPGLCRTWYDTGLGAFACSQMRLTEATANGTMSRPGRFTITAPGRHSGSSPGVVQVIGGPLRVGARLSFIGAVANDEVAIVNCYVNRRVWAIRLERIRLTHSRGTALIVEGHGVPTLMLHGMSARESTLRAPIRR